MQNRHRFTSFPAAEFYARSLLDLEWPFGEASYRDKPTARELVSPLMTLQAALKFAEKIRLVTPENASAIHTAKSRYYNNSYRVVIKLSALTCTRDELIYAHNKLAAKNETLLKLLANFLNETHAPFNEKFWAVRKKGQMLHLSYMAPGKKYQNIPLVSEDGSKVRDENHNGAEYEAELMHNFNRQNTGFHFSAPMQAAIRKNLQSVEYKNSAYYYFNDDFMPALVSMLYAELMPSELEQQHRAKLIKTRTSTESTGNSSDYVRIPPSPPETHEQVAARKDPSEVRIAISAMTNSSGLGLFGNATTRIDADFAYENERAMVMSSGEKEALLPPETPPIDDDKDNISEGCCLN